MTTELLQTKLFFPRVRPSLVPRPGLIDKLNAGLDARLILVSAPAGFGKTTLVAEWISNFEIGISKSEIPTAWLSLDEADNDPSRFFTYVIAALKAVEERLGRSASGLLQSLQVLEPASTLTAVVTGLINDIAAGEPVRLVLDDYHAITNETIHQSLSYWLDNAPPQFRLVVVSRTDPPLPLARLRVRGELLEIGGDDLRFTLAETAEFLNQIMKLDLAPADVAALEARTEGWIASLQLAALSLQELDDPHQFVQAFHGDNRYVMDYLAGEVLQRQPGYVREFLLQTAILKRLSVQLCNAVTGQVGSQQILEDLDQRNLFVVPLDDRRHWYRYHHLFAEFLQAQLQRTWPERVVELHQRAAGWYEKNGFVQEAIEHSLAAQDFDLAADILTVHGERLLWQQNQTVTLVDWLDSLPPDTVRAIPRLFLVRGWALMFSGHLDRMEQHLSDVTFPGSAPDVQGELAAMRGEVALYRQNINQALSWLEEAAALLPSPNVLARGIVRQTQGYAYRLNGDVVPAAEALQEAIGLTAVTENLVLRLFANTDLAEVRLMEGKLQESEAIFRDVLVSLLEEGQAVRPVVANAYIGLGNVLREQNQLQAAADYLEKGIELSRQSGYSTVVRYGLATLAQVKKANDDGTAALELMQEAVALARQTISPWIQVHIETQQARLWLAIGNEAAAAQWAARTFTSGRASGRALASIPSYQRQESQTVYAWTLLAQGQVEAAVSLLDNLRPIAEGAGWLANLIELHTLIALCHWTRNDRPAALASLNEAFALAAPQGFVRLFLDQEQAILPLLRWATRSTRTAAYANHLLGQAGELPASAKSDLVKPLTDREVEILRLMAEGLSNQQIGERLFIARGTVGKHSSNIFAKLDAANRAEAVLRARELNLLS